MSRTVVRVAVSGSQEWPWPQTVHKKLEERWRRTRPGQMFLVRHGFAERGADWFAHEWVEHRKANPDPEHAVVDEERVPADWENCVTEPYTDVRGWQVRRCPETVNGRPHRRPNPGWPHNPRRGTLETYCPSAGHRRNPDVVAHPDHPVEMFLAFMWNNSPGTKRTIEYAEKSEVYAEIYKAYGPRRK